MKGDLVPKKTAEYDLSKMTGRDVGEDSVYLNFLERGNKKIFRI